GPGLGRAGWWLGRGVGWLGRAGWWLGRAGRSLGRAVGWLGRAGWWLGRAGRSLGQAGRSPPAPGRRPARLDRFWPRPGRDRPGSCPAALGGGGLDGAQQVGDARAPAGGDVVVERDDVPILDGGQARPAGALGHGRRALTA